MSVNTNIKKSYKLIEIPVNNFKDVAVPYHLKLLEEHKQIVEKESDDKVKMRNESTSIRRLIAQLKGLLYELDNLRAQVENCDLDKFDMKTVSLRKTILQIISEYSELLKKTFSASATEETNKCTATGSSSGDPIALQINANLEDLQLNERKECLEKVERIETDIRDLHSLHGSLCHMVGDQQRHVNAVEENVENTQENVNVGVHHILTASRLKASVYPVTGAVLGTCIGGPIGFIAGLKVGGFAALSCGLLGYVGGEVFKKHKVPDTIPDNVDINQKRIKKED